TAAYAVAAVDDHHFLRLGERLADLACHIRQDSDDHLDHCGLVVLLKGFSFLLHGLGGRSTLRLDDGCLCKTARSVGFSFGQTGGFIHFGGSKAFGLGGGSGSSGFGLKLEFGGGGERFHLVALGVGRLLHVGFQLALLAQDFLLLELDLFLLLDDVHLHFFRLHELAGLVFLQIIGEVGLGLFLVHHRLILRDVALIIALGLGNFAVGGELGFLSGLRGQGRTNHGIAVGFGLGDLSI